MTAAYRIIGTGFDVPCEGDMRVVYNFSVLHVFMAAKDAEQLWDLFKRDDRLVLLRPNGERRAVYAVELAGIENAAAVVRINRP